MTQSTTGTSATVKGLKPSTDYSCSVRAKNSGGTGASSTSKYVRTKIAPPATPANVRATATHDSATVSWNSSAGAQNYDVLLGGRLYSTTGTSRTITGLKAITAIRCGPIIPAAPAPIRLRPRSGHRQALRPYRRISGQRLRRIL